MVQGAASFQNMDRICALTSLLIKKGITLDGTQKGEDKHKPTVDKVGRMKLAIRR